MRSMSGGTEVRERWMWVVAWLMLAAFLTPARAQSTAQQSPPNPAAPAAQVPEARPAAEASPETLHLLAGRSLVITSPARIARVSVADPTIVEAVGVNPNQVLLNAKATGATSVVIWDEAGQSQTFDAIVDFDTLGLAERVRDAFPNEKIRVDATKGVVTLSGQVSAEPIANKALQMAEAMVGKKENVVSLLQVPVAPTQGEILLQVKFAEVNRTALSQLGINILSLPDNKIIASTSTQQFTAPAIAGRQLPCETWN